MLNPLINPHTRAEEELIPAPEGSEDLMSQEKLFKSDFIFFSYSITPKT